MDKAIKKGLLSGIAGGILSIVALNIGGHLIDSGKRAIGIGPRLEITTHICSSEQLSNQSKDLEGWLKEKAIADKGYTEIKPIGEFTYSKFDIAYNGSAMMTHDSLNGSKLLLPKFKGRHDFFVHVDDFGHHQTFKPEVNFLDNDSLLREIFAHARKHKDQLYEFCRFERGSIGSDKKEVPIEYKLSLDGVNYEVHNLSVLTGGDTNTLRQLWLNQVTYK
jgi:hypothetical protein